MKRKLLYLLLPLIPIAIGIIFACYYSIPRLEYTYSSEYGGYMVSRAFGDSKEYYIPKEYNGSKVVGVSTRAFFRHKSLERIVFEAEENIDIIGRLSFSECPCLKDISISYASTIEKNAFSYCKSLDKIDLRAKYIGGSAFFGCESLNSLTLNLGVESIGSYAFSKCNSLEELYLPKSIKHVYIDAFSYSGLKQLYAPIHIMDNEYLNTLDYVTYY